MGKGMMVGLALLIVFVVVGVSLAGWLVGTRNEFIQLEQGVVAQYDQNRNNYDNFVKSVVEVAQVPAMYTEALKKVALAAIQGRYGEKGSQAVFQWIKEQNPTVDVAVFTKVQQVIEAGRLSFETNQKTLIDKKRVYQVQLQQFPGSLVAGLFGFPRIDLSKFDIVTSDRTERAFETKKDEAIRLSP
jgi:hypothetical protein